MIQSIEASVKISASPGILTDGLGRELCGFSGIAEMGENISRGGAGVFFVEMGVKYNVCRNTLFMFISENNIMIIMCVLLFCFLIKKKSEIDIVLFFYLCLSPLQEC